MEHLQTTTPTQEYLDKIKLQGKTKTFNFRLSQVEMDNLGKNAQKAGMTIAAYISNRTCFETK